MAKLKKWIRSPIGLSLTPVFVGFLLTLIYDYIKDKPILTTVLSILVVVWKAILAFLCFDLKIWWVLLGIAVVILILYIVVRISESKNQENDAGTFLHYTSDTLKGVRWSWCWEKQYDGKYDIESLHPVCSKCETPLVPSDWMTLICPRCNSTLDRLPDTAVIKVLILDNVKRTFFAKKGD